MSWEVFASFNRVLLFIKKKWERRIDPFSIISKKDSMLQVETFLRSPSNENVGRIKLDKGFKNRVGSYL